MFIYMVAFYLINCFKNIIYFRRMKITTTKALPPYNELAQVLQNHFANRYTFRTFRIGKQQSIIAGQSAFVGAQISATGNEITIEGVQPTLGAWFFSFLMQLYIGLTAPFTKSPFKKLEKEIGTFLQHQYN